MGHTPLTVSAFTDSAYTIFSRMAVLSSVSGDRRGCATGSLTLYTKSVRLAGPQKLQLLLAQMNVSATIRETGKAYQRLPAMCPVQSALHGLPSPAALCLPRGPEFSGQDPEYSRTKPSSLLNRRQFSSHSTHTHTYSRTHVHTCTYTSIHTCTHNADQLCYKSQYGKRRPSASIWTKAVFCLFTESILNPPPPSSLFRFP